MNLPFVILLLCSISIIHHNHALVSMYAVRNVTEGSVAMKKMGGSMKSLSLCALYCSSDPTKCNSFKFQDGVCHHGLFEELHVDIHGEKIYINERALKEGIQSEDNMSEPWTKLAVTITGTDEENVMAVFDLLTNTACKAIPGLSPLPFRRLSMRQFVGENNKFFLCGGRSQNKKDGKAWHGDCASYDPVERKWLKHPSSPSTIEPGRFSFPKLHQIGKRFLAYHNNGFHWLVNGTLIPAEEGAFSGILQHKVSSYKAAHISNGSMALTANELDSIWIYSPRGTLLARYPKPSVCNAPRIAGLSAKSKTDRFLLYSCQNSAGDNIDGNFIIDPETGYTKPGSKLPSQSYVFDAGEQTLLREVQGNLVKIWSVQEHAGTLDQELLGDLPLDNVEGSIKIVLAPEEAFGRCH